MRVFLLFAIAAGSLLAQIVGGGGGGTGSGGGGTVTNAARYLTGAGTPTATGQTTCTAGRDFYWDSTSTTFPLYGCDATNTFAPFLMTAPTGAVSWIGPEGSTPSSVASNGQIFFSSASHLAVYEDASGNITPMVGIQHGVAYTDTSSSTSAYTITIPDLASPFNSPTAGMWLIFTPNNTNTGSATLAINGGTAYAIRKYGSAALSNLDLQANVPYLLTWRNDQTIWIVETPSRSILPVGTTSSSNRLLLQDQTDTTKQAQFDASAITTATTRTYKLPDASGCLVHGGQNAVTETTNAATFDVRLGEIQTVTLNGNLTTWTVQNGSCDGQQMVASWLQDATGGWTVTAPSTVENLTQPILNANARSQQLFIWDATRSKWMGVPVRNPNIVSVNMANGTVASTTQYSTAGATTFAATEGARQRYMPVSKLVTNFCVTTTGTNSSGGNNVFTIRKTGVDTALTVTFANSATATTTCDNADVISFVAGDKLSFSLASTSGTSATVGEISWTEQ